VLLVVGGAADAQARGSDVKPVVIQPGQVAKLTWRPAPPHPNVAMCCGGALQLSWSPMDSGVVSSGKFVSQQVLPVALNGFS